MVALPRLYPATPDGTATTMAAPVGASSYAVALQTNDGDTSYATSGLDSAGSVFVNLDDTPTDFGKMDTLTVSCVVKLQGTRVDDTTQLYAQIFTGDEATALTSEIMVTDHTTGGTYTVDSTAMTLSAAGSAADSKTTWDGAKLRLRWVFTKSAKSDGIALRVTQAYLDGTYTATTPNTLPTASATATPNPVPDDVTPIALDGTTSSDPDGTIASYKWEKISGPAGSFDTPTAATCTFTPGLLSFTETFNKADSTVLGPDLTWTEIVNDLGVQSNQLHALFLGGGSVARAEHDMGTPDHSLEITVNRYVSGDIRLLARMDANVGTSSATQNYIKLRWNDAADALSIERWVEGTATTLASVTYARSNVPVTMKIECIGTAIKAYMNGVQQLSVTETAHNDATHGFGGVRIFLSSTAVNNDLLADTFKITQTA